MTLLPGDRVVVLLDGKPDQLDAHRGQPLGCTPWVLGHRPEQQEKTGEVIACPRGGFPCQYGAEIDHGYVVRYDVAWCSPGLSDRIFYGGHFAEHELELVAPTTSVQEKSARY